MIPPTLPVEEILRCARDESFVADVAAHFDKLDRRIAEHRPVCTNRGECCNFAKVGHSLFVTSTELAYFLATIEPPLLAPPDRSFCPYQAGGMCTVRAGRPAGCRVFFCDPAAQGWQPALTEESLLCLAAIGERFDLPYAYVEWTEALRHLGGRIVDSRPIAELLAVTIDRPTARS